MIKVKQCDLLKKEKKSKIVLDSKWWKGSLLCDMYPPRYTSGGSLPKLGYQIGGCSLLNIEHINCKNVRILKPD